MPGNDFILVNSHFCVDFMIYASNLITDRKRFLISYKLCDFTTNIKQTDLLCKTMHQCGALVIRSQENVDSFYTIISI